jgi:hypothetical protein
MYLSARYTRKKFIPMRAFIKRNYSKFLEMVMAERDGNYRRKYYIGVGS